VFDRVFKGATIAGLLMVTVMSQSFAQQSDADFCASAQNGLPKNCVAYDRNGDPFRVKCDNEIARFDKVCNAQSKPNVQTKQKTKSSSPAVTKLQPTPAHNSSPNSNSGNNDGLNIVEGVALGLLAIGAAAAIDSVIDEANKEAPAPSAPADGQGRTMNVQISSVHAIETTFGFGGDEVFLLASNGQRFPANSNDYFEIDEGQSWKPNASLSAAGGVSIDLREWDSFSSSDHIGNLTIDSNHQQGSFTTTLRGDGAVYEIAYNVGFSGQVQQNAQPAVQQQSASQAPAPTPSRVWGVDGVYGQIIASDCRDCGEDTGIMLACQGEGLAAVASVPWVATETGFNGSVLPIEISVGNQHFTYTSTLSEWGMVGFVPEFIISPNDPIVEALQAGSAVRISFEGGAVAIGLKGSRDALDIFKAHCGWDNIAVNQPVNDNQPQPIWHTSSYQDLDTGRQIVGLTFGIPETDAVGFYASCEADGSIQTSMQVDFGNHQDGSPVNAFIQGDQQGFGYQGRVFIDPSGEWAGVGIRMSAQDPIWQLMQSSQQVTYGIIGGGQNTAFANGASQAISQFIAECRPQPVVSQQPVQTQTQPTSSSQGGNYRCDNGSTMSIEIASAGAASIANIVQDNGNQYALIKVPTTVGTKYSNGEATLNTSGNTAQLMANGNALFCEAQ